MSTDPAVDLLLPLYEAYKETAYSSLLVGIVFGAYVVLYGTSLYILLRNGGAILRSIPRLFMLIITSAMFILGLVTIVLNTSLEYQQFKRSFSQPGGSPWPIHSTSVITAVSAATSCVIFILSDVVCAWRAAVLWNYDRRILAILALFVIGTIVAGSSNLGVCLGPLFSPSYQPPQNAGSAKPDERTLILVGPTLATNVLSTVLIGIQTWRNRSVLIKHVRTSSVPVRVEKVFAMLVESGFVYCCIWVLYLISTCRWLPDLGSAIIGAVIPYASGLYPTVIVIFVVLQKSPTFTIMRHSASTHFSNPQEPSTVEMRIPMSAMYIRGNDRYADLEMTTSPGPPLVKGKQ
ncbi:hypothetical protein BGW80DRAFT_1279152 [Lactifluus volemus]|nr:hypothetical protein BGW80DRAFT_1279152 [Lactifluus volemus]